MKRRNILVAIVGFFLLAFMPAFLWAREPGKLVMETIDKGLAILQDSSLKGEGKKQERRQRLWEELSSIFDFEEMSKRALGPHWKKRSPEEKREFVELFTEILKDTYIGKTDTYSGEKIVYLGEKQENDRATVQIKLITHIATEIPVDFHLRNNQETWKVYDAIIEGVSLVNNYRSQFHSILIRSPYEELVQKMKEMKEKGKEEVSAR